MIACLGDAGFFLRNESCCEQMDRNAGNLELVCLYVWLMARMHSRLGQLELKIVARTESIIIQISTLLARHRLCLHVFLSNSQRCQTTFAQQSIPSPCLYACVPPLCWLQGHRRPL